MSDEQSTDESADSQQESEQQPTDSDQPATQSDDQSAEQSDQSTEQSEEQPADTEQAEEQPSEGGQTPEPATDQTQDQASDTEQTAQQAGDSDQSSTSTDSEDAVALAGGSGDTAKTSARKVKVIAEFTEAGDKFIGEIKVILLEYDKNGVSSEVWDQGDWQNTAAESNVITTPAVPFTTSQLAVTANARIQVGSGSGSYQVIASEFVFPMPSGDTLRTKFEIEIGQVNETVSAPDEDQAKGKVFLMPKFKDKSLSLDAQALGNQKFRVTGKYVTGSISSPDGRPL